MTLQEIKNYFDVAGGKNKVKTSDMVWTLLIRAYNDDAENKSKRRRLSGSCGSCRSTAYKWLIEKI